MYIISILLYRRIKIYMNELISIFIYLLLINVFRIYVNNGLIFIIKIYFYVDKVMKCVLVLCYIGFELNINIDFIF